ncbi:MAG: hypothetical protein ACRDIY_12190 [Chloroflexota bacterium]
MLDCQSVLDLLRGLDWSRGLSKDGLLKLLLDRKIALPNEFLSAIQPTEIYRNPERLIQSVPDVVWTIHSERERRARGQVEVVEATERTRAS